MYNLVFFNSFFINLILSLFFIILNLFLARNLNNYFQKNFIFKGFDFSYLFSFYFIFLLDCFVFNFLILLNSTILFFYFYIFIKVIFFIKIIFDLKKIKINIKFRKLNFIYKVTLICFFILSLFPVSDADSIAIHLNFPITYFYNLENLTNSLKYYELSLYFNSEVLLINSILFKSSNIGSLLNITVVIIFSLLSIKNLKKNNFFIFFLSTPLLLFLLNTQKPQIFFAILYLVVFIFVYETNPKKIKKKEILILCFLIIFYISGKISYILLSVPLVFFIILKFKKTFFIKYLLYGFCIFLVPIFLKKIIFFGDPIAPFFSNLFSSSLELKNLNNIIANQGWKSDNFKIKELFNFYIPLELSYITVCSGIGFLYLLYKNLQIKIKNYFYVSISGVILIYLTGQIAIRFFIESILILYWYSNFKINYRILNILKVQLLIILISVLSFLFIAIKNISTGQNDFLSKFAYTFYNAKNIKSLDIKKNILLFDEVRDSIFYEKNIFVNSLKGFEKYNQDHKNFDKYYVKKIKENKIKYIISKEIDKIPKCIKLSKIKNVNTLVATRIFLKKNNIEKKFLYLINYTKCS